MDQSRELACTGGSPTVWEEMGADRVITPRNSGKRLPTARLIRPLPQGIRRSGLSDGMCGTPPDAHLHAMPVTGNRPRSALRTAFLVFAAGITWAALALQLVLFLQKAPELGLSVLGGLAKFLTFMTNLTGLATASVLTSALWPQAGGVRHRLSRPAVQGALVVYTSLVFVVYHFMLAGSWHPEPAWLLAAVLLHYVVPACYLVFWVAFVPRGALRWSHLLGWQVFPIAYAVVIMAIGQALAGYPYPFLDVERLGWKAALLAMAMVLAGYVLISLAVVAFDRWRVRAGQPD